MKRATKATATRHALSRTELNGFLNDLVKRTQDAAYIAEAVNAARLVASLSVLRCVRKPTFRQSCSTAPQPHAGGAAGGA